jgi:hypothetical protein
MASRRRGLPPLPKFVYSALGPIPIELVKKFTDDKHGIEYQGEFDQHIRRIRILKKLSREQAWQVLRHEWLHAVLFDSGLTNVLTDKLEEQLCDAISTSLTAEMIAKLNTPLQKK